MEKDGNKDIEPPMKNEEEEKVGSTNNSEETVDNTELSLDNLADRLMSLDTVKKQAKSAREKHGSDESSEGNVASQAEPNNEATKSVPNSLNYWVSFSPDSDKARVKTVADELSGPSADEEDSEQSSPSDVCTPEKVNVGGMERAVAVMPIAGMLQPNAGLFSGHQLKQITWKNKSLQIVTQNENGPCPLIAIVNVLLLRGTITLPATKSITADQLIQHVGDVILNNYPKNLDPARVLDYERNINDAITVLPRLLTGLDVNVMFTGVKKFEYTPECIIFDLLNITLYHGWLVDPQDISTVSAVGVLGYNQLVDKIIVNKCSDRIDLVTEALIAEQFLEGTASQLTYYGLCELNETLNGNELAVLFRNNHFSTILKFRPNGAESSSANSLDVEPVMDELYQLVTDQGFLLEPRVVWESMVNIEGDGMFVDSNFNVAPLKSSTNFVFTAPDVGRENQIDQDYLLALSLNEEMKTQSEKEPDWDDDKYIVEAPTKSNTNAQYAKQLMDAEERRVSIANEAEEQPPPVEAPTASPPRQKSPPHLGTKSPSSQHGSKTSIQSGSKSPTQGDSKSPTQPQLQPLPPVEPTPVVESPLPSRSRSPDSTMTHEEPHNKKSRCSVQ